jgi:hypothetical protein
MTLLGPFTKEEFFKEVNIGQWRDKKKEREMMNSKHCWFIFIAFALSFLNLASNGFAQDDEETRPTLRGFQGVHVVVEQLSPAVEKDGLSRNQLQKDTELILQTSGIKVLSKEEFLKTVGKPYLYVNVNISILRTQITRYIFYIRVEFNQDVSLIKSPMVVPAATWSTGGWGIDFSLENIRDLIKDQVDKFVNAYFAVNVK